MANQDLHGEIIPTVPMQSEDRHSETLGEEGEVGKGIVVAQRANAPTTSALLYSETLSKLSKKEGIEYAGELLANPETVETGLILFDRHYEAAIRSEKQGRETLKDIVSKLAKFQHTRQKALDILRSPRTYGFESDSYDGEIITNIATKETNTPALPTGIHETNEVDSGKSFGGLLRRFVAPFIRSEPSPTLDLSPDTIRLMRTLTLSIVESVGDDDLRLSCELLDRSMNLRELEAGAHKIRGEGFYSYFDQDVEPLCRIPSLAPKLIEVSQQISDRKERSNALFTLYRHLAKKGLTDEALNALGEATDISHAIYNDDFAYTCRDSASRERTLMAIRRLGGDQEIERLVVVGRAALEAGEKNDAKEIFNEAWRRSKQNGSRSKHGRCSHEENIGLYFVSAARDTEITFDGMDHKELLDLAIETATKGLNGTDPRALVVTYFADQVILELSIDGRFEEAEKLVLLLDQRHRIDYWGAEANRMRPEERDQGYRRMAIGAAHRKDYEKAREIISKMIEFKPDTYLDISRIVAKMGDFENSFVSSLLGAAQVIDRGGISVDKDDIGLATRVLPMSKGEGLLVLGVAMAEKGYKAETVGKVLEHAAETGLDNRDLAELVDTIRNHRELTRYLVDILNSAALNPPRYFEEEIYAKILETLREFFPDVVPR